MCFCLFLHHTISWTAWLCLPYTFSFSSQGQQFRLPVVSVLETGQPYAHSDMHKTLCKELEVTSHFSVLVLMGEVQTPQCLLEALYMQAQADIGLFMNLLERGQAPEVKMGARELVVTRGSKERMASPMLPSNPSWWARNSGEHQEACMETWARDQDKTWVQGKCREGKGSGRMPGRNTEILASSSIKGWHQESWCQAAVGSGKDILRKDLWMKTLWILHSYGIRNRKAMIRTM